MLKRSAYQDRLGTNIGKDENKEAFCAGWADQLIMPQGSVDYYDEMVTTVGGGIEKVQDFARLFMAPGIAHCGTDTDPFFEALVRKRSFSLNLLFRPPACLTRSFTKTGSGHQNMSKNLTKRPVSQVDWVEKGVVPETLPLTVQGGDGTNPTVLRTRCEK